MQRRVSRVGEELGAVRDVGRGSWGDDSNVVSTEEEREERKEKLLIEGQRTEKEELQAEELELTRRTEHCFQYQELVLP